MHATRADLSQAFCSYCGYPPMGRWRSLAHRVCMRCEMGMVLRAPPGLAPRFYEPFVIVDLRLRLEAVSHHAEGMLKVDEPAAVGVPLADSWCAALTGTKSIPPVWSSVPSADRDWRPGWSCVPPVILRLKLRSTSGRRADTPAQNTTLGSEPPRAANGRCRGPEPRRMSHSRTAARRAWSSLDASIRRGPATYHSPRLGPASRPGMRFDPQSASLAASPASAVYERA
jgi:hypothetical protein